MTGTRKRTPRNKRLTDITLLGLEPGKLYEFKGRSRLLYKEQSAKVDWKAVLPKIRTNDHLMFFKAELWQCSATRKKTVWGKWSEEQINKLKKSNNKIIEVKQTYWNSTMMTIRYKPESPLYTGMLYVGFGEKFGWINIVQMSKKNILAQFKQVVLKEQQHA